MNKLQIALREMDEEWFASLPAVEDAPEFEVSKQFLKWEQRVIYGKKNPAGKVAKVMLIAAALIILFSVIALSTTKGKEFLMQFFKDSAVYSLIAEQSNDVTSLTVDYLPKGFKLNDVFQNKIMLAYHYQNQYNHEILIRKSVVETTADFHYDDKTDIFEREGITYIVSSNNESYCSIIWNYNNYFYEVSGNADKECIQRIAFNVQ